MPLEWLGLMIFAAWVTCTVSIVISGAAARSERRRRDSEVARLWMERLEGGAALYENLARLQGMGIDVRDVARAGLIAAPGPWPPPPADAVARITGESEDLASTRCYPPGHDLAPRRRTVNCHEAG